MRFGKTIRYFCSILFVVGMVLYLPVAVYVPALTFNQVSGINVHVITPVVCLICTFYTCVGGLKAVVWTDAIQSFVMYGTVLTICIKGTLDLGGLQVVLERNWQGGRLRLPDLTLDPTVRLSMFAVIVGGTLHKIQSSDVNQISIQRFLSLPNMTKVKQTMFVFTSLLIFLLLCCCYMGLLTYATYHDCDPLSTKLAQAHDQLPTILIMRILGTTPGLAGLFVAGVFSAALSSLSTGLNSLACVLSEDLIKPFLRRPLTELQTALLLRFIVVIFGLTSMILVFVVEKLGTVLQLSTMMGAVTMGPLLGFFICGVCLPWINEKSVLIGGVVSFCSMGWLCGVAQYRQMENTLRHPKLPVSVEGCTYAYDNVTAWDMVHNYEPSQRDIFHLSFMWYTGFGGILCSLVAVLASSVCGHADIQNLNPILISPLLRRYLPISRKTELGLHDSKNSEPPEEQQPLNALSFKQSSMKSYLELRFDRRLRFFGSFMFVTIMLLWMPISIYVPALTFNQVTGIDIQIISVIVCITCTIYTCIGGFKGVIWTDVLQCFVMISSLVLVIIKGTIDLGGLSVVFERNWNSGRITIPDMTLDPTVRMSILAVFVGGTLLKLQFIGIMQASVQRFLSLPDMKAVKNALILFIIGIIFLLGLCIYLGILAYAAYYDCDPISTGLAKAEDQVVPYYVMQIAGAYPGLTGLFVSGVFSAALSSLSTGLNSLSGVILKDFIEPFRSTPLTQKQTNYILRGVVLLFGFNAVTMVNAVKKLGLVMQLSSTVGSITAGPLMGVYVIGMCIPFINGNSALCGCVTAFITLAYIAVRSQFDIALGILKFPTKPVSTSGCTYTFINQTMVEEPLPSNTVASFHHISFLWYTALGATITIIVSLLATLYFGRQDTSELDPNLIIRQLRKYLKSRKYKEVHTTLEKPLKKPLLN